MKSTPRRRHRAWLCVRACQGNSVNESAITVRQRVCVRVRVIDYREAGYACACVDKNFNSHLGAFVNG